MPHKDLSERLLYARDCSRGMNLKPADVVDLCEEIASLAAVITALQSHQLLVSVPAEAVADTIADCLCLDLAVMACIYDAEADGVSITGQEGLYGSVGESLLAALDAWRAQFGKPPISGQQIMIDGNAFYQQLVAKISGQ